MAITHIGENVVHTIGELPAVGSQIPDFTLTGADFMSVTREPGKRTVLNIFLSVDTGVCSASIHKFNELAAGFENTQVICVSPDLPFAIGRFCGAEGIANVEVASTFKSSFGNDFGVQYADGRFEGLLARSVIVVDTDGTVLYTQLVPVVGSEPDYDGAVAALARPAG